MRSTSENRQPQAGHARSKIGRAACSGRQAVVLAHAGRDTTARCCRRTHSHRVAETLATAMHHDQRLWHPLHRRWEHVLSAGSTTNRRLSMAPKSKFKEEAMATEFIKEISRREAEERWSSARVFRRDDGVHFCVCEGGSYARDHVVSTLSVWLCDATGTVVGLPVERIQKMNGSGEMISMTEIFEIIGGVTTEQIVSTIVAVGSDAAKRFAAAISAVTRGSL